jgi:ATP-dependent Clp protease protease subunit
MKIKGKYPDIVEKFELRHNPIIITVNKFTEESAKEFREKVSYAHNTGQKVIPIVIDSYGGEVYALLSMIATIRSAELPVATVIMGKAMSCGAILASFGSEGLRFASPDSTMMIHDVSSGSLGKVEEIKATAEEANRLNNKLYTMLARNCGKKDSYFMDIIHEKRNADWYLEPEEMVKHGIVNHIRVPTLNVDISVKIDIE